MRNRLGVLATVTGLFLATTAHAAHHLWDFTEAFSNASGTVQYVEMFCTAANEQNLGTFSMACGANTVNFVTNLPSAATANTWLLMATSNFAAIPGAVTPDYIIPANFFPTGGGTLNYASGTKTWVFGAVPTDGIHSLLRNGSTAVNSPTNFAGTTGSISIATAVPALQTWGIVALAGALLLMASGLLRRRGDDTASA